MAGVRFSMAQFSVHDAKANLSRLIADALAGGDVVIARGSVPVVRLVPLAPKGRREFGALKGRVGLDASFHDPLTDEEQHGWNLT